MPQGETGSREQKEPRRGFLSAVTGAMAALVAAMAAMPGLTFLSHPLRAKTVTRGDDEPIRVAGPEEVRPDRPLRVSVFGQLRDGWMRVERMRLGAAWLVRASDGRVRAFSTACPHLGCSVDWNEKTGRFDCPCHNSEFGLDGGCLVGPAPRGLDELEVDATDKDIRIRYRRFRPDSKTKEPIG